MYGVVIMRKFRALMEPFQDLKISEYVEYLTRISSEYFTSCVSPYLTSAFSWLMAYVIPWINKGSLVLYIARMRVL